MANSRLSPNNTSNYRGVSFGSNAWQAHITVSRKIIYLGAHSSKEEAARAYDKVALEFFGEFASLNFPPTNEDKSCQTS